MEILRRCFLTLSFAAFCAGGGAPVCAQDNPPTATPEEAIHWLRFLVVEDSLGIALGSPANKMRLFTEVLPDGRTWLDFIAETIAPDWARVDEATTLLLAEADKMAAKARAVAGTPEEAAFNLARKNHLAGAARLLKEYAVASGQVFDANAAPLVGQDLPDWLLPGEVQLRHIAGAGRLNTETLEFAGRLSGELVLPELSTALVVAKLSFDSRGNVDLTAYGQTSFPANDPSGVTVRIPPRNPLLVHLAEDGDFRVAGGVELVLPDGNTFQAYFDVDDPDYSFGLAFTGVTTFDLVNEISLVRPVINFDPANPPALEVLDGMARFFGSFGKGMETFIGESPSLPSLDEFDVGTPPDFEPPETAIPFDVFDAWIVAVGNEHVRPALTGPVEGTATLLREALSGLRTHLEAVRADIEPGLNQLQRLSRVVEMNGKIREVLEDGAARAALGDEGDEIWQEAGTLADEALRAAVDYLQAVPPEADLKTGLAAMRLAIRADANSTALGLGDTGLVFSTARSKLDQWTANLLAQEGFNPDGSIADSAKVDALGVVDLRTLAMATLEIDRIKHTLSADPLPFAPITAKLLQLEYQKARGAYLLAIGNGDDAVRVRWAAKLPEYAHMMGTGLLSASDEEWRATLLAYTDTWVYLRDKNAGSPRPTFAAQKRLQAAREQADGEQKAAIQRKEELFGRAGGEPDLADSLDFSLYQYTFWQRVGFGIRALRDAGILDAVVEGELKADFTDILDFYRQALEAKYGDATLVQQSMEDAYGALVELIDIITLVEDFLPEEGALLGEFRQTWEALHLEWTAVAEARKAHWMLAAYARELTRAAGRYGDGVGPALESAFATAGTEAVAGLGQVVDGLAASFAAIDRETVRFMLPGDLEVRRLFGDLTFNRVTGDWEVGFGGLLVFPDVHAEFEVVSATLASNGDLAMSLRTSGPVPFGLEDSITLDVQTAFALTGNVLTPAINSATASGRLKQEIDGQPPHFYDATIGYEFLDPGHRLRVETSFQDPTELFTNEIVLFSGGFGFDLETDGGGVPQQGGLETNFNAGILLRPEAQSKPIDQMTPDDFYLSFAGAGAVGFSQASQEVTVSLNSGTLTLPPDIFSDETGTGPATVSLSGSVCITISLATGEVSFCDDNGTPVRLTFQNIAAQIPGLPGAGLAIPNATLLLSGSDLPVLENLNATLTLPLPGTDASDPAQDRSVAVAIAGEDWRIDGLPEAASLNLVNPLQLVALDGFVLELVPGLEAPVGTCPPGLGFRHDAGTGVTTLTLAGGMRATVDPNLLWDAGADAALGAEAQGCFEWEIGSLPTFTLGSLAFSGRAQLGGPDGVGVVGLQPGGLASVTFTGTQNLFSLAPGSEFEIRVDGALDIANFVRFGLVDTAFTWDGSSLLPTFDPGGAQTSLGDEAVEVIEDLLPVYLTSVRVEIINRGRDLIPQTGQPGLLDPDNVKLIVSGGANLPAGAAAIESGVPGVSGQVEDLGVSLRREGDSFVPDFDINTLTLQITNLDIPPLGGIEGGISIGNLDALDESPPRPEDIYFAGMVGATVEDVGATVMLALKPTEFIGACFELNAGPAGIPLDGGAIGGLLLTGGKGGINFKNEFADPCDFKSYIDTDTDLPAAGSPERPGSPPDVSEINYPAVPDPDEGFDCLEGPFPPQTVNPLCEPHPDTVNYPDRFVYKGTILSEAELNALGITRAAVPGALADALDWATGLLGAEVMAVADAAKAAVPPAVPAEVRAQFESIVDNLANSFDDAARDTLRRGFEFALSQDPNAEFYDLLVDAGAAGIPCFDFTLKVAGTFSHAAVSTVLSGTGGVTLSSTGTAVLEGSIDLVGIPVGTGAFAFSLTDSQGDLNPSFGGVAVAEVGPLEMGSMSMAMTCDGCYAAVTDGFLAFLATNANGLSAGAREFLFSMMDRTVPLEAPRNRNDDLALLFFDLDNGQRMAYVANLLNVFQLVVNGDPLPVNVTAGVLDEFMDGFRVFVVDVFTQVNPQICFSGQVGPKLFGFPLTGGADSIAGAHFLYGRRTDPATMVDYQELTASVEFSPSYLMMYPIMAAYQCPVIPAIDTAEMGFSLRVPALTEDTVELALTDPGGYVESQLTTLVEDGIISFAYELSPLGLTLGNGQARIIMPRIDAHPERPGVNWSLPYNPDNPGATPELPTRTELILAALSKGQMKNPFWRGQAGELNALFTMPPNTDPDTGFTPTSPSCDDLTDAVAVRMEGADPGLPTLAGLDLARDYFPHGGIMFGGELGFPNVIAQMPPPELFDLLTIPTNETEAGAWLSNAETVVNDYLADTTCVGQLAGYMPAPNPVFPPELDWSTATIEDFLRSVRNIDAAAVIDRTVPASLYATDQILFAGWLETPLLGMPLARGEMEYDASAKVFTATAAVPSGTWLHDFVQGSVTYEFRAPRYLEGATAGNIPVGGTGGRFAELAAEITAMNAAGVLANGGAFARNTIDIVKDTLPRASLVASANVQIPSDIEQVFNVGAQAGLEVFAFSAFYDPDYAPADTSPYGQARRRGGVGLRGDFELGYFPDTGTPIAITIPDASFAITPDEIGVFPALTGQFQVGTFDLPGLPAFTDGLLAFNSAPDPGAHYLSVGGTLEPFVFKLPAGSGNELFALRGTGPGGGLSGTLEILHDEANPPTNTSARLAIEPLTATMASLGTDIAISVNLDPVVLNSTSTQPWAGAITISNSTGGAPTFALRDPFSPGGSAVSLEFTPTAPVTGTISGVGQQSFELELTIPNGFQATFFKGKETETTVQIGSGGASTLYADSTGRFYVDLGQRNNVGLPGILTASGHLEFGYNPVGSGPIVWASSPATYSLPPTDLNDTATHSFQVGNSGNAPANVVIGIEDSADFSVNRTALRLAPGQTQNVSLIFHPSGTGSRTGTLVLTTSDELRPRLTRNLAGTGISVPRYFQSRDRIDLGLTVVGDVSRSSMTIGNAGSAPLHVVGFGLSGTAQSAGFSITPSSGFTVQPGNEQLVIVEFAPLTLGAATGDLYIDGPDFLGRTIPLTGSGATSRWLTILDSDTTGSTTTLRDIRILTGGTGWAVGDQGTIYETRDGGHSWTPRHLTAANLKAVHVEAHTVADAIAAYHFEEPQGSLNYRDDGPNGYHGSTPSTGNRPRGGYEHGRVGAGLYFDNPAGSQNNATSDYVNLDVFDLTPSFAISLWVNPADTRDNQFFVSKHTSGGSNQFLFGFWNGGYFVGFNPGWQWHSAGLKQSGWQHLVVNASYAAGSDTTTVQVYRDASLLWSDQFTGSISSFNGGRPWVVGHEWDADGVGGVKVSDVFEGSLDELIFFDRALSPNEITALSKGILGQRILFAGENGTALQSETLGRNWHQVFDQTPNGMMRHASSFRDFDYTGATTNSAGKVILAGSSDRIPLAGRAPVAVVEDAYDPNPKLPGDERYGLVALDSGFLTGSGESLHDATSCLDGRSFGVSSLGKLYTDNGNPASTWPRHGTLDLPVALNAIQEFAYDRLPPSGTQHGYVAVGNGGKIVRALNPGSPTEINHGVTTENLRGIAWNRHRSLILEETPELYVVGDNGVYLTSENYGLNWTAVGSGLEGNNHGIDVRASTTSFGYTAWVAGEANRIQLLPNSRVLSPRSYFSIYPGELDFELLTFGQSRTLPLRVCNRGKIPMTVSSVSLSGARFSIAQGNISRLAPGDAVTLYVRYKPTVTSELDLGEIRFILDSGAEYRVPLVGRCLNADWQPIFLQRGGAALDGEVVELADTRASGAVTNPIVYALLDTPGQSRLFRSTNMGASWSEMSLPYVGKTSVLHLEGLSAQRNTAGNDNLALAGGTYNISSGALVDGIILYSANGGASWSTITPNDGVNLPFSDVALYPDASRTENIIAASSATSGSSDVWQTSNWGGNWTRRAQPPANAFRGGKVTFVPEHIDPAYSSVVATSGPFQYARNFKGDWPYGVFGGLTDGLPVNGFGQTIRDMTFAWSAAPAVAIERAWVAGDNGLFWSWERGTGGSSPFASDARWYPAANQEVFGTTSLKAVTFGGGLHAGYAVGGSRIFRSADSGRSWDVEFEAGGDASIRAVAANAGFGRGSGAWAGGSIDGKATIWRNRQVTSAARGILLVNDIEFFDEVSLGNTTTRAVSLQNVGSAALNLHNVRIESDDPVHRFRIEGTPPASIPAGATRTLTVAFDGTPDPVNVAALDPQFFLRFENGWGDTTFNDHSRFRRDASAPGDSNRRPLIHQDREAGERDRCLSFDGNDYAFLPGPTNFPGDFSVAFWIDPEELGRNQNFIGKHDAPGTTNQLLIGYYGNQYHVRIRGTTFGAGTPTTGWQHIVVNGRRTGGSTEVTLWRDGEVLWQATLASTLGNVSGRDWVLGGDWDGGSMTDTLRGRLDDVALFNRVLSEAEIRMLMNESSPCGDHHARLVINSGSEDGQRITELRGEVEEASDLVVIDTVPSGQNVTIDGVNRQTPASVAVRCNSTSRTEWVDGSLHTITAPAALTVTDATGNVIDYRFSGWDIAGDRTAVLTARTGMPDPTASYAIGEVTPLGPPPSEIPEEEPEEEPGTDAIGEAPRGPFLRLTGGNVTVGGLGGGGFSVNGELYLTLTRLKGNLSNTGLRIPDNGNLLEVGAGSWLLDMEAGDHFTLEATPPSVTMLGYDLAPKSAVTLSFDAGSTNSYDATFRLRDEFKPVPGFLEFKRGQISIHATTGAGSPAFQFSMDGGLRAFPVPAAFNDPDGWAINTTSSVSFSSSSFDTFTIPLGNIYANSGFFLLSGNTSMTRSGGGPLAFNLSNATFLVNGVYLASLSGSVSTGGELVLQGTLPHNNRIRLAGNDRFAVHNTSGSSAAFSLRVKAPPQAAFELSVPSLTLKSSATGFPSGGLSLPGLTIDSSGAFDTGKILLPTWTFDGIQLSRPSGGTLANNYIRLKRGSDGATVFDTKAQLPFLLCDPHQLALSISDSSVSGSFRGKFCVLPEPISLRYASGSSCQFSGSAFGWTIYFGSACAGYRNDATGICIGLCP